jgi:4-amino-4-deoxy-L-arabinose transferase-like glycosyltransferase
MRRAYLPGTGSALKTLRLPAREPRAQTMSSSDTHGADRTAELSPSGPYRAVKQAGLVLLCAAWIVLGLLGHDPWKPDDAVSFGVAYDMLQRNDWLVPHIAGVAQPDRPPLLYAFAAATARVLEPLLPLHDGARLAVGLCLAATLWLLSLASRELYGRAFRWLPVLIFIGCVGLWDRGHQLSPDVGVLAADALALYALALALRRPGLGGVLLGLATGLAFLCRGSLGASLIVLTALLIAFFPPWRRSAYAATLGLALAVALPLLLAWPLALNFRSPALFDAWRDGQSLATFLGLAPGSPPSEPLYYLKNLLWFAWPALPLALWTLWLRARGYRGRLGDAGVALPLVMLVLTLVVLSAGAEPRANFALPILLPMSLLAAAEVDTLKRGSSGALDWFGILTFGLLAVVLWGLWIQSLATGLPEGVARVFRDTQPGFRPPWQWVPLIASMLLTLLWLALVRPARRSNRRAVLNWAAGMTLVWGLSATIWLPYVDSRRSYRPVAESLAAKLPAGECVAGRNLGEPQRALFEYFAGLTTAHDERAADRCPLLLAQLGQDDPDAPPDSSWEKIWEGRRRGDDTEHFVLFRRAPK